MLSALSTISVLRLIPVRFLSRDALQLAVLAVVKMSVCPSISLSQSGYALKRRNVSRQGHIVAPSF